MSRPAIQQRAGHYIGNLGFSVVPLLPHSKRCVVDDWPAQTFGIEDFAEGANLGLRSVGGLVIVDDDFPTSAVACMDRWLPRTGAIYGRPLRPRAKRLYRCPDLAQTVTFTDIDHTHLLQLRVGLQDMAPPSVHPDTRERLQWEGSLLPPTEVAKDELVAAVRYAWTARLLAKYWPTRGRHELRLAYARVLLETLEIPDDTATDVLEWACRLGGSDGAGIADARRAIESTRRRLAANDPTVGASTVRQLLPDHDTGKRIVMLLRSEYGKTDLVLNPNDPMPIAREFVRRYYTAADVLTLRHQQGVFYGYDTGVGAYEAHDEDSVRADLYRFLEPAYRPGDTGRATEPVRARRPHDVRVRTQPARSVCGRNRKDERSPAMTLKQLETELATMLDQNDIPRSWTPRELQTYEERRRMLQRLVNQHQASTSVLAEVEPKLAHLTTCHTQLNSFRQTLVVEFLALPKRDTRRQNYELSIRTIDRGLDRDTGYALDTLRLGQLLRDAGYVATPGTEGRIDQLPWYGGLPETEQQVRRLTKQRDEARAHLDYIARQDVPAMATA